MTQYNVTGMSCAACSARVEKAVAEVPGVENVTVSLLTNSMSVEGKASPGQVIAAVEKAGYGAAVRTELTIEDGVTKPMIVRLIVSIIISAILMILCMSGRGGHQMSWSDPARWLQAVLALLVMGINYRYFVNGWRGIRHRAPNMDTLVALGSLAGFLYGYYDSAAMILALINVGKTLEARSKGETTNAIKALMKLTPQVSVAVGEIFEVKPGESIPADAEVLEGISAVDESALTGESIPVDKAPGDSVSAGTINTSGFLRCRAVRVGSETTLSQIIRMVSDAASGKAPIARIADRISGIFVPVVIGIAIVTFIVWSIVLHFHPEFPAMHGFTDSSFGFALQRAISVLVVSCPCALGLATPVAIMVGNGVGARNGILYKNSTVLENAGKVNLAAVDKTGTITSGKPVVTDVISLHPQLFPVAAALESRSVHPLARAVTEYLTETTDPADANTVRQETELPQVENFAEHAGNGVSGSIYGKKAAGGSRSYIEKMCPLTEEITIQCDRLAAEGKTPILFLEDTKILGIIAVADAIREDSAEAVRQLQRQGIRVVMLTGDNEKTAAAIGRQAGVDTVIAGVLPQEKAAVIRKLKNEGKVMMIGDGINDAPALTEADTGVAVGAGTDVAIDAAQIVLMKSRLTDVPAAVRLSRAVIRNIHENLFWAFFYNIIGIPLAAGVWIPLTGWTISPMFCAGAMSLSSFCVCMNALRLNLFRLYDTKNDRRLRGRRKQTSHESPLQHYEAEEQQNAETAGVFTPNGLQNAETAGAFTPNGLQNAENMELSVTDGLENAENMGLSVRDGLENADSIIKPDDSICQAQIQTENDIGNKGEKKMIQTTIEVKGMMCPHCEAHTNEAVRKAFDVQEVTSDHAANQTVIISAEKLDEGKLAEVIREAGYEPGIVKVGEI